MNLGPLPWELRVLTTGTPGKSRPVLLFIFILFICLFFLMGIIYLFIYLFLWLCWVFVSVRGLSLVAASGGHSSLRCAGLSVSQPLLLQSTGSRCAGSVIVAHGPRCSAACGIFPDQGSNPCPLHWQADSQPLHHQGSPPACPFKHTLHHFCSHPFCPNFVQRPHLIAREAETCDLYEGSSCPREKGGDY